MRKPILVVWLLLPFAAWTYHEGPGQELKKLDEVDQLLDRADKAMLEEDWVVAIQSSEAALKLLPADKLIEDRRTAVTI